MKLRIWDDGQYCWEDEPVPEIFSDDSNIYEIPAEADDRDAEKIVEALQRGEIVDEDWLRHYFGLS